MAGGEDGAALIALIAPVARWQPFGSPGPGSYRNQPPRLSLLP